MNKRYRIEAAYKLSLDHKLVKIDSLEHVKYLKHLYIWRTYLMCLIDGAKLNTQYLNTIAPF